VQPATGAHLVSSASSWSVNVDSTGKPRGPIVVTGAASGIGLALTQLLTAEGADVVSIDKQKCSVPRVAHLQLDIGDYWHSPLGLGDLDLPSAITGLANVAGAPGTLDAVTVLSTNFLGPKALVQNLLPLMTGSAAIVNVASISAGAGGLGAEALARLFAVQDHAELLAFVSDCAILGDQAYRISKRALVEWSQRVAAKLVPHGPRVNCVSPGPVMTPMLEQFRISMGTSAIDRSHRIVGRHGKPTEIAQVIKFLLSPQSHWINGANIPVDGGLLAHRAAARDEGHRRRIVDRQMRAADDHYRSE
jgi:NAD(P)-dependent dehydrogenase (short-subunit alcohol dehydrogenase family)